MLTKDRLQELYNELLDKYPDGISNTSTKKFDPTREYLATELGISKNDIYTDRQVRMMIENDKHEVVGIVDLINFDPKHLRAEVGIVIRRDFRNKGYAQAAINKIKTYSLEILHLHQLYACIDKENRHSLNLFEHCGFVCTNELNDWLFDGKKYHKALLMQLLL